MFLGEMGGFLSFFGQGIGEVFWDFAKWGVLVQPPVAALHQHQGDGVALWSYRFYKTGGGGHGQVQDQGAVDGGGNTGISILKQWEWTGGLYNFLEK